MSVNIKDAATDIESVLLTGEQIRTRVRELGKQLSEDYKGKCPIIAGVLKGASVFYTDLIREFDGHMFMDYISVSSYGTGASSSGNIVFKKDFDNDITGKDVIIVEDIIDSGLTLKYLKELLSKKQVKSVKTVALLDKYECHPAELSCDYTGFKIENKFVVGYGLDFAEYYRNLPYIGILKESCYK